MTRPAELTPTERIALGIDVSTKKEARRFTQLASELGLRVVKYEELASATSLNYCSELAATYGLNWVADVKLHTTPNTTAKTVKNIINKDHPPIGITIHISADPEPMRIAQEVADEIVILGVTVLTTEPPDETFKTHGLTRGELVTRRAYAAAEAGLKGLVASALEVGDIKRDLVTAGLHTLVTGVRLADAETHEQANVDTPHAAILNGADLVVVAREVIDSNHPEEALANILRQVETA